MYGDCRCIPRGYRLVYSCRRIIRLMCIVSTLLGHKLSTGPHIGQLTVQISTCLLWFSVRCISWRPSCKLPVSSWEQAFLLGLNMMIFVPKVFEYLPPANKVWGKVIFSQACVNNSVHGGGSGACSRGGAWSGEVPALGGLVLGGSGPRGGVWSLGGVCSQGGLLLGGLVETPRRLILPAVRILLECILV